MNTCRHLIPEVKVVESYSAVKAVRKFPTQRPFGGRFLFLLKKKILIIGWLHPGFNIHVFDTLGNLASS